MLPGLMLVYCFSTVYSKGLFFSSALHLGQNEVVPDLTGCMLSLLLVDISHLEKAWKIGP